MLFSPTPFPQTLTRCATWFSLCALLHACTTDVRERLAHSSRVGAKQHDADNSLVPDAARGDAGGVGSTSDFPDQCPDDTGHPTTCADNSDDEFLPVDECPPGTFVVNDGSDGSEYACGGCRSGTYSDSVNAAECTIWTQCGPGEFVRRPGTATRDQLCEECADGQTSNGMNSGACVPEAGCPIFAA